MTTLAPAVGVPIGHSRAVIPQSHVDLLTGTVHGVLTTMGADGRAHSTIVWVDYDGSCVLVNTTLQRASGRNMLRDSRVSLLVVDPFDTSRYLAVRGDVEFVCAGAIEHLDRLTRRYTKHPQFYGCVHPAAREFEESRVICRIHARRVIVDAIHR